MKFFLSCSALIAMMSFMHIQGNDKSYHSELEAESTCRAPASYKRLFLIGTGTTLLAAASLYTMLAMNGYDVHNLPSGAIALSAFVTFTISGFATVYCLGKGGYDFLGFNNLKKS